MHNNFDNAIIICNKDMQKHCLQQINSIISCKFISMQEFKNKIMFSYDEKAILYLMNKYDYSYEIAEEYLENLYFIDKSFSDNSKISKLQNLKEELENKGLLIYDDLFKKYIQKKKVIIYNYPLSKFEKHLLKDVSYKEYCDIKEKYLPKIYEFSTMEEEIIYVCHEICHLIEKGVDVSKIKLTNISENYIMYLEKYFKMFNLKLSKKVNNPLDSLIIGKTFLDHLSLGCEKAMMAIDKYQNSNAYKQIMDICNKYVWADSDSQKILISKALHNTSLKVNHYKEEIEVVNYLTYPFSDEYVFMLDFNEGIIPKVYKDEDYLLDDIKPKYLDTTLEKNIFSKNNTLRVIKSINNLVITYKLKDDFATFYPSSIIDILDVEVEKKKITYDEIYSEINACITFNSLLDNFFKYGEKSENLAILKDNLPFTYNSYNHFYKNISKDLVRDYIKKKDKFVLSYTAIDNYYRCAFRFYLANILNISDYEEKFSVILGNIYHHILMLASRGQIDVRQETFKYIKDNNISLTSANKFFLEKAMINMEYLLKELKRQKSMSYLDQIETEKKIELAIKDNIYFKGFIDKIMYTQSGDKLISAIIDYKTYVKKPTLRYMDYGISMQLPVYMYLAKKVYPNINFAGFYMQNILLDNKSDEEKLKSLKLIGYSNSDKDILKYLDYEYENSTVISGIKVNKDGNFSAMCQKNMLSNLQIENITSKVEDKIMQVIEKVENAEFKINPKYHKSNIGCEFCPYKDICFKKEYDYEYLNIKEGEDSD